MRQMNDGAWRGWRPGPWTLSVDGDPRLQHLVVLGQRIERRRCQISTALDARRTRSAVSNPCWPKTGPSTWESSQV
jgi:hypothetical protein